MASNETQQDDGTSGKTSKPRNTAGIVLIGGVVAVIVIVAGFTIFAPDDQPFDPTVVESPVEDARPVGAGTLPDGEVDEAQEGLLNETDRGDFIDPSAPTDAFTNPLLEADGIDAPQATSIEELDPGPAVEENLLDRMAPETSGKDAND